MNDPGDEQQPQPPTLARLLMEAAMCEARLASVEAKIVEGQATLTNLRVQRIALEQELSALRVSMDRSGGGFDIRGLNGDPREKPVPQKFNRTISSWEDR